MSFTGSRVLRKSLGIYTGDIPRETVNRLDIHNRGWSYDEVDKRYTFRGDVKVTKEFVVDGKLKLNFNSIGGDFDCCNIQLTSLEGVPEDVPGSFICSFNKLTSLQGAPKKVEGDFICNHNMLKSLEGTPASIGKDFVCSFNELESLQWAPKEVKGDFYCSGNKFSSSEKAPEGISGRFICATDNSI